MATYVSSRGDPQQQHDSPIQQQKQPKLITIVARDLLAVISRKYLTYD